MTSDKSKTSIAYKDIDQLKFKSCFALKTFYMSNKEDFREEKDYFSINVLHDFVIHRLLTGIESCCFNIGYITNNFINSSPNTWIQGLDQFKEIAGETSLLLNQLCDEVDFEFEVLGDGINVDHKILRHSLKKPYSPLKNIPTRYHGIVQDLIFDDLYRYEFIYKEIPTPVDMMWKCTYILCSIESIIRYFEAFNRPKLYTEYKPILDSMRHVVELLSMIPDFIVYNNNSIVDNNS